LPYLACAARKTRFKRQKWNRKWKKIDFAAAPGQIGPEVIKLKKPVFLKLVFLDIITFGRIWLVEAVRWIFPIFRKKVLFSNRSHGHPGPDIEKIKITNFRFSTGILLPRTVLGYHECGGNDVKKSEFQK